MRLEEVRHRLRSLNQRLPPEETNVTELEALCARLWTGPMYIKYSASDRLTHSAQPVALPRQSPVPTDRLAPCGPQVFGGFKRLWRHDWDDT